MAGKTPRFFSNERTQEVWNRILKDKFGRNIDWDAEARKVLPSNQSISSLGNQHLTDAYFATLAIRLENRWRQYIDSNTDDINWYEIAEDLLYRCTPGYRGRPLPTGLKGALYTYARLFADPGYGQPLMTFPNESGLIKWAMSYNFDIQIPNGNYPVESRFKFGLIKFLQDNPDFNSFALINPKWRNSLEPCTWLDWDDNIKLIEYSSTKQGFREAIYYTDKGSECQLFEYIFAFSSSVFPK